MNFERVDSTPAATPLRRRIPALPMRGARWPGSPGAAAWPAIAGMMLACAPGDAPEAETEMTPTSVLFTGATVLDGSGEASFTADVAVEGDRITFVGDAVAAEIAMRDTIALDGLLLTPGFIDMHSHINVDEAYGRPAVEFLTQGITTGVVGVDGSSSVDLASLYDELESAGVGKNIVSYVGHGSVRQAVIGMDDRAPTADELEQMRTLVRRGMEDGAFGLSTGLFYTPGYYAEPEEVIALGRVAAEYPIAGDHAPVYDTHDRDLGATYQGIGYLNSIREAIHIGAESGLRTIFSHFNAQGAALYGRASEGAALIDSARAEGIEVAGAQHVYTSTMSSLRAYTIPRWAQAGGPEQMVRRFQNPDTARVLDVQTMEMLEIRGGPEKIVFADARPEFNGKTLADVAAARGLPVPEAVREIMSESNPWVMNRDLYDVENTRYLATMPWMMTCTDGATPVPGAEIVHPRVYGTFPKKIKDFVDGDGAIGLPFAIRGMSGLAADFLRLDDRGYIREGMIADIAVIDLDRFTDRATYDDPHQYSEGVVHVLVNGRFAIRDDEVTGELAGRPLRRPQTP
ncbi:N-acyl-D-amino-acid deacylase family protein [Candidatus Palauibacter sp.]|uniref:N-acyl-D-amino-acid deacylase family protein n=1 Tax=Candidatus Palauibacter sp. TaxID=3101350 RepID=UPI003C701A9F